MTFIQLVSALKLTDAQLARAIATEDKAARHAKLLRDSTDLLDRIENYEPRNTAELREMLGFFTQRSINQPDSAAGRHDFQLAISLARRFGDGPFSTEAAETVADVRREPIGSTGDPCELARQISESRERVMAIDHAYRFLAASPAHAQFLKTSPVALIGRHLCGTIGPERFERRAREKIDLCLQGAPQDYIYLRNHAIDGQRVTRCTATPVRDARNRVYCALIHSRDVTTEAPRHGAEPQKESGAT